MLGLDGRVGVIAAGMLADIIVWDEDPLADISVLQRPAQLSLVVKDGRVVDRGAGGVRPLAREPGRARITLQG